MLGFFFGSVPEHGWKRGTRSKRSRARENEKVIVSSCWRPHLEEQQVLILMFDGTYVLLDCLG